MRYSKTIKKIQLPKFIKTNYLKLLVQLQRLYINNKIDIAIVIKILLLGN